MNTLVILFFAGVSLAVFYQLARISNFLDRISGFDPSIPSDRDNDTQGKLMLVFGVLYIVFFAWVQWKWSGVLLPRSASLEGETYDMIMNLNWLLIVVVFVLGIPLTFYFCYKYRGVSGRKAYFYHHNNKIELIWTVVPTIVLSIIVIIGLVAWSDIMYVSEEEEQEAVVIEVYAKQFSWTARYAGEDNVLGQGNVRFVKGSNLVGADPNDPYSVDDVITNEIHLPVGRRVVFKFRSQDVIHSAFMPHFRAQMNCVPGMITQFSFTPSITTEDMRSLPEVISKVDNINKLRADNGEDDWEYDFLLLCNKICGNAHYNMQMKIIVESPQEYQKWMDSQAKLVDIL